jgi:glycosyltransferase involved in cell wall biosynthesis
VRAGHSFLLSWWQMANELRDFQSGRTGRDAQAQAVRSDPLSASVVITSKNRKHDLRRALRSCIEQTAGPEVLVIDDGSTDGTEELVRREFPSVRIVRDEVSKGLIVQRNRGAQLASGDVIFSIDDDAEFSSARTVEQTLAEFNFPSIAAVSIPFINVNSGPAVHRRAPNPNGTFLTDTFVGTAHAVRRDIFWTVGGYREFLFHQGEEEDLCIRMLDIGMFTRLGNADPVFHYESPLRDHSRRDYYGSRNRLLFSWYNVPLPYLLVHMPAVTVNQIIFGLRTGRHRWAFRGAARGVVDCMRQISRRHAVRADTYRLFRQLRFETMPLEEVGRRYRFGAFDGAVSRNEDTMRVSADPVRESRTL